MPADENRVFKALGALENEIKNTRKDVADLKETSTEEHRKVHQIVDAMSESVRNILRMVEEMRPHVENYKLKAKDIDEAVELTEGYKLEQAEKRGEDRIKGWLYTLWASVGGLVVFALGKLWDLFTARPHP